MKGFGKTEIQTNIIKTKHKKVNLRMRSSTNLMDTLYAKTMSSKIRHKMTFVYSVVHCLKLVLFFHFDLRKLAILTLVLAMTNPHLNAKSFQLH